MLELQNIFFHVDADGEKKEIIRQALAERIALLKKPRPHGTVLYIKHALIERRRVSVKLPIFRSVVGEVTCRGGPSYLRLDSIQIPRLYNTEMKIGRQPVLKLRQLAEGTRQNKFLNQKK